MATASIKAQSLCYDLRCEIRSMAATIEAQEKRIASLNMECARMRGMSHHTKDVLKLERIGLTLRTFYRSELSFSSVRPVMALAEELNPDLLVKS